MSQKMGNCYVSHPLDRVLSAIPYLVSGMNFPKNFANLSMMSPCHCYLIIFRSPVHHHRDHYHYFHYASLNLSFTSDSKPFP